METGLTPRRGRWGTRMDSCLRRNDGTLRAPSAVPSPRRVRGVLSPYRERGNSALARLKWGGIPAFAGMTARGRRPMGYAAHGVGSSSRE